MFPDHQIGQKQKPFWIEKQQEVRILALGLCDMLFGVKKQLRRRRRDNLNDKEYIYILENYFKCMMIYILINIIRIKSIESLGER